MGDREQVLQSSIKLGFLTGFEDKVICMISVKPNCQVHETLCVIKSALY